MKNTWKIAAAAALATVALAATAMPTKRQLAEAQQIVKDLTSDDISALKSKQKTPGEVAAKHLELAAKADTEAGKYLLLQGAFRLYARGGDYDAAADVLQRMKKEISGFSPEVVVELVNGEMRRGTESKAPKILAIYKDARHTIKYRKLLAAAEVNVEKLPTSKNLKQLAECHVHLGDWKKALEAFARARVPVAKWELDPKSVSDCDAFKAAEYWWNYEAEEAEPFRAHAAVLYRQALDEGLVTGLRSEVVKKRIADVEATGGTDGATIPNVNGRADRSTRDLYCVIDLSAGSNAANYPVSYLAAEPNGGWTDEYKTTKLVLRRIEPGSFIMGIGGNPRSDSRPHRVTLTKPFYIGVFEVTQKQYELVMGNNPSKVKGSMRPVERVLYATVRGKELGSRWPLSFAVDADSFIGKFRKRTGMEFDIPTNAQWEYACRAGTTSIYNNGGDTEDGLRNLDDGNNSRRNGKQRAITVVGLFKPNAWGLYDMHGNVWEWTLDWLRRDLFTSSAAVDPVGPDSGTERGLRGGFSNSGKCSTSALCNSIYYSGTDPSIGFRLALRLSDK